jgi:thiamine-monophosphate kinase
MNTGRSRATAFISYAGPEREQALRVKEALERRDIRVLMDTGFEAGQSVLVNIGGAINEGVVVALISSEYLDRKFTEIEVSAVMTSPDGKFLPVVIDGPPRPATERGANLWTALGGRTHFPLSATEESLDRLAAEVRRIYRADRPASAAADLDGHRGQTVALLYDWEDGHLIDEVAKQCSAAGMQIVYIVAAGVAPESDRAAAFSHVAILWTAAAKASPDIELAMSNTIAASHSVTYLLRSGSPPPPDGAALLRLAPLEDSDDQRREERRALLWVRDRPGLRARLDDAVELNDGIPFHLLGDKFCASRESAAAAAAVYRMAVAQLPRFDDVRLGAVLAHAAACRFRGDWIKTEELLADEPMPRPMPSVPYPSAALALRAERLSLDFEFGRTDDAEGPARFILSQALAAGDWPLIIAAHRQLGMIEEERGRYSRARDHMDRACHYAEDLLDTELLAERIPSYEARVSLRADCLRELAAVEWRAGESDLARTHLGQAKRELEGISANPAADYLLNVVTYQLGRVNYSVDHDYEEARNALRTSYLSLQKYDNPIRLATVLESLVQLEMDFTRGRDDSASLRATLEKIRRIRSIRKHRYMIARTTKTLGDLDFSLGNFADAKDQYEEARFEFNRLGKFPEKADTLRSLGRCESRLGNSAEAVSALHESLRELPERDHHVTRAEIRSEIARLNHQHLAQGQIAADIEMTEVGEYAVHDWIRQGLLRQPGPVPGHVILGAGDDGAVLRTAPDEDLVVTTDSVPAALLVPDTQEAARYAARFAVVATLSDLLSMGAEPLAVLLNLHVRRATAASWTHAFLRSAADEAARYGAVVVGGDLRERNQKSLTATAVGRVRARQELTRRGANVGDMVALTLSPGPEQEFNGLGARWALELAPQLSRDEVDVISELINADVRFTSLGLPLETMRAVAEAGLATAAIDTSDGILACAELIGSASGVGIELFPDKIEALINADVARLGRSLGIAPFLFALSTGFDWEVVLTVPKALDDKLQALNEPPPGRGYPRVAVIGEVRERLPWAEDGVLIRTAAGRPVTLPFFTGEKFMPRPYDSRAREWLDFAKESTRLLGANASGTDA